MMSADSTGQRLGIVRVGFQAIRYGGERLLGRRLGNSGGVGIQSDERRL